MGVSLTEQVTATRATLSESWEADRRRLDWMAAPTMADYVNRLVSGVSLYAGGHWAIYAERNFVSPHLQTLRKDFPLMPGIEMLAIACGDGHIEASLIKEFNWPISSIMLLEYDSELRARGRQNLETVRGLRVEDEFFDFNSGALSDRRYDIIFAHHCLHHASDLEGLIEFLRSALKPGGLIVGSDYFGPSRFQIEFDVLPIIEDLYIRLPKNLRKDLSESGICAPHDRFRRPTIEEVRSADHSEAVRSSDLRTLLFSNFDIVHMKPMGGTLLRWLLQNRAGNFNPENDEHVAIIRLMQLVEAEHIRSGRIKSDDLFFVLKDSSERI